jgi:hypothetical protein
MESLLLRSCTLSSSLDQRDELSPMTTWSAVAGTAAVLRIGHTACPGAENVIDVGVPSPVAESGPAAEEDEAGATEEDGRNRESRR